MLLSIFFNHFLEARAKNVQNFVGFLEIMQIFLCKRNMDVISFADISLFFYNLIHFNLIFAGYIVAVDSVTPTIFIMHENGSLVKYIECSEYMTEPSDIAIFGSEYYICDFKGHSIVVMHENGNYFCSHYF